MQLSRLFHGTSKLCMCATIIKSSKTFPSHFTGGAKYHLFNKRRGLNLISLGKKRKEIVLFWRFVSGSSSSAYATTHAAHWCFRLDSGERSANVRLACRIILTVTTQSLVELQQSSNGKQVSYMRGFASLNTQM